MLDYRKCNPTRRQFLGRLAAGGGILLCDQITQPALADAKPVAAKAPFPYCWGSAHHVLPETHNNESGYFSLCEGLNGKVYVGTTKYGVNSYLVEFDPATSRQRIVIDTHRVCGLKASGYAAQAKIHTPNFVGPSGAIYVGSKQGYRMGDDKQQFPGGYVMTYDPRRDRAVCLGMPRAGYGVGDVVADEARAALYVVSERVEPKDPMRWLRYDIDKRQYHEIGEEPTPYATTLIDSRGHANVLLGDDLRVAQYDPVSRRVRTREILLDGKRYQPGRRTPIPIWKLAADGRTACMILMNDPTLIEIDLLSEGETLRAQNRGRLIEGRGPDCRCGMDIGQGGKLYAVIRIDNTTGFGRGQLHHLVRYDLQQRRSEDLGVLAVRNPDFFAFDRPDGTRPPWSHGFHRLPDNTLTPLHHHMAVIAGRSGAIYVTILYPFTLLKIDI